MTEHHLKTSIAILGCGDVGSTLAYTLLLNPICSEVIMVDLKKELLEAQVRDLGDATYGGRAATKVRAGTHKDAGQADIIVITAGAKQKPGKYVQVPVFGYHALYIFSWFNVSHRQPDMVAYPTHNVILMSCRRIPSFPSDPQPTNTLLHLRFHVAYIS